MNKHEADTLIAAIRSLLEPTDKIDVGDLVAPEFRGNGKNVVLEPKVRPAGKALTLDRQLLEGTDSVGGISKPFTDRDVEAQYQAFKNRMIEECHIDPVLLHLLTQRPEILLEVDRNEIALNSSTLRGRIATVAASGFLAEPRRAVEIRKQMERTGPDVNTGDLSKALKGLRDIGILIADDDAWSLAPGVKVTERSLTNK